MTTVDPHPQADTSVEGAAARRDDATHDQLPPLGPDSILWDRFGDWRSLFVALSAGLLQIAQKDISRSLVQQSNVFDNEVARLVRSAFPIIRTVYEGPEVGAMIRDFHKNVKGTHPDGSRYHSLNPEVYYWAHATFSVMPLLLEGKMSPKMSRKEKEQYFQECRTWYTFYGVAEPDDAPTTYAEFVDYMDRMYETLGPSETIDRSRIVNGLTLDPPTPDVPRWLWKPIAPVAGKLLLWAAIGLLPEKVRDIVGLEWTAKDQRRLDIFSRGVRTVFSVLPRQARMVPIATRAYDKAEKTGEVLEPQRLH